MLYADHIALCATRREVVEKKLEEWGRAMEDRGLKINRRIFFYLRFNGDGNLDGNSDVKLLGQDLERVNTFKYLGATLVENGDLDAQMTHINTIRVEKLEEGIGDSERPKNKFESQGEVYKTVVRPAMVYGAETWALKKAQEKKLDVAEMRMLR